MVKTLRPFMVLAVGTGLALTPQGAQAQRTHVHDPVGDSSSGATDITRLRVAHAAHRIRATATIPRLKPGRLSGTELLIRPRGKKRVYAVTVLRDRRGRAVETSLSWRPLNDPVEPTGLPCQRVRTSLQGEHVVVSVAKTCLTKSRSNQPIRAKVRTIDGTTGLQDTYYDDQTRFTRILRRGATARSDEGPQGQVTASNGVVVRGLPTMFSAKRGVLSAGKVFPLTCVVTRSVVRPQHLRNGDVSNSWYRLPGSRSRWVSALYVRNVNGAPPYCGTGRAYRGRVLAKLLVRREAPTTRANSHGGLVRASTMKINCTLHGEEIEGNDLWYNLPQGLWVSARYVANTGPAPGYCTG